MKIRRYKKVNKNINFYVNNFGFRQPYQLLVDGTFCFAALNNQINIADNIPRYLQGEIKLITTQCAIIEMENLGHKLQGALQILKKYATHQCGHNTKPIPASKCLLSMLKNRNESHYIIATQDRDLQRIIRSMSGVPLLYLHGKTPILDQPSELSQKVVKEKLTNISLFEQDTIKELKEKSGLATDEDQQTKKKKKKKGINPLSCKKKKKLLNNPISDRKTSDMSRTEIEKKKKRKRIRIPEHVREELLKK